MAEREIVPAADAADRLKFAELRDVTAVYDRWSGRTHILDVFTAEVLRVLATDPDAGEEAMRASLATGLGMELRELDARTVSESLARLRGAGLS